MGRIRGKAFLFDMDGTLISSHEVVEAIWRHWASRQGIDGASVIAKAHGRQAAETVRLFAPAGTDPAAETAWINHLAAQETKGIVAIDGAGALLDSLAPHEWALVTSAKRSVAERWLAAAELPQPATFITADDVSRSKPDPEGFRSAAQRLDCPIEDAIVFEDSEAGLEAGRRSGAKVVGIGAATHLRHLADAWISDFRQIQVVREADGFTLHFDRKAGATEARS